MTILYIILFVVVVICGYSCLLAVVGVGFKPGTPSSAPIQYPVRVSCSCVPVDGPQRPVTLEIRADCLMVYQGRSKHVLARIWTADITSILYENKTVDTQPMAGFAVNYTGGQLQFFSDGVRAPQRMWQAAQTIQRTAEARKRTQVQLSDVTSLGDLTAHNIVHTP